METWSNERNLLHESLVSAGGNVIGVMSRTATDSYSVFVEDPLKAPQAVVSGPGAGNPESPSGWLAGSQSTTHIVGNKAVAVQNRGGNIAVAAVVAGAADDEHVGACGQSAHGSGYALARALHQRLDGRARRDGGVFRSAHLCCGQDRLAFGRDHCVDAIVAGRR